MHTQPALVPDPPPQAVAAHHKATVSQSYSYRVKDRYGRWWVCRVPVHGKRHCTRARR